MTRVYLLVLFVAVTTLGLLPTAAGKADDAIDPRLEKILADWQKRQHWFDAVEYQVAGKHVVPKGAYSDSYTNFMKELEGMPIGKTIPAGQLEGPAGFTVLLDFVRGRERRHIREQSISAKTWMLLKTEMQDAFNGTEMKCLVPKEKNPELLVGTTQPELITVKGNMKNCEFKSNYYPVFFAQGRIYNFLEPILPGQFRNRPDPKVMYVHGTGVIGDRPCTILRTQTIELTPPPFLEYWVDPAREGAIVRYRLYGGNVMTDEITIDYANTNSHWLPSSWRWTVITGGKVLYYEDMKVQKVTINPPLTDDDFELSPLKPGMLVEDRVDLPTSNAIETPQSKLWVFRIDNNGERIQIADPAHHQSDQYEETRPDRWERRAWFGAFLLCVGGCVTFVLVRRNKLFQFR